MTEYTFCYFCGSRATDEHNPVCPMILAADLAALRTEMSGHIQGLSKSLSINAQHINDVERGVRAKPTVAPADVWHERNDEACRKDKPQSDTAGGDDDKTAYAMMDNVVVETLGGPIRWISHRQAMDVIKAIKAGKVPGIVEARSLPQIRDEMTAQEKTILDLRKELETTKQHLVDAMTVANRAGEYRAQIENAKIEHQTDVGKCSATINTLRQQLVEAREIAKIAADERDALRCDVERLSRLIPTIPLVSDGVDWHHQADVDRISKLEKELAQKPWKEATELIAENMKLRAFHACFDRRPEKLRFLHEVDGVTHTTLIQKWEAARQEGGA